MREIVKVAFTQENAFNAAKNLGIDLTPFEASDFLERHQGEIADAMYEVGITLIRRLLQAENQ